MVDVLVNSDPPLEDLTDDDDDSDNDLDSDLPSFSMGLNHTGDSGSSFRVQNDPSAPFQRTNYIERKGAVDIRCSCEDVIHGAFSASPSDKYATLVVLKFRFDKRKRARRFQEVKIELEFKGMKPGQLGPEVFKISPDGNYNLVATTQHEDVKQTRNLQLGGAAPVGGITATGTLGWEKTVSRETSDHTTVVGSIDLVGRNYGPSNCVTWELLENATTKTGVPNMIQTAILLKRKDDSPFQCVVKIDATVDLMSSLEKATAKVFGGKGRDPRDDPVLFDPSIEPTNKLRKYDTKDLGAFGLESVCDVTFLTTLGGVLKDKAQK